MPDPITVIRVGTKAIQKAQPYIENVAPRRTARQIAAVAATLGAFVAAVGAYHAAQAALEAWDRVDAED